MSEIDCCEKFLFDGIKKFSSNVYNEIAPRECENPYVTFEIVDSKDLTALGGVRIWSEFIYRIGVHSKVSFEDISSLFESISNFFHLKSDTDSENVISCVRIDTGSSVAVDSGVRMCSRFADFRIRIS